MTTTIKMRGFRTVKGIKSANALTNGNANEIGTVARNALIRMNDGGTARSVPKLEMSVGFIAVETRNGETKVKEQFASVPVPGTNIDEQSAIVALASLPLSIKPVSFTMPRIPANAVIEGGKVRLRVLQTRMLGWEAAIILASVGNFDLPDSITDAQIVATLAKSGLTETSEPTGTNESDANEQAANVENSRKTAINA